MALAIKRLIDCDRINDSTLFSPRSSRKKPIIYNMFDKLAPFHWPHHTAGHVRSQLRCITYA